MKFTLNKLSILILANLLLSTISAFSSANAQKLPFPPGIISVAWSPDGSKIAGGGTDGLLQIWDATTEEVLLTLSGHTGNIYSVAWSPDSKRIVSGGEDLIVRVWDAETGELLAELSDHDTLILRAKWSPDGTKIASLSWGGSLNLRIWDPVNYKLSGMLQVGEDYGLDWSPDGSKLGFANTFIGIYTIDASLDNTNENRLGTQEPRSSIAWNSDGTLIAAGGYSSFQNPTNVYIIDSTTGDQLAALPGHTGEISVVSWSPDDKQLVSVGQDKSLRIWDTVTDELITTISLNYSVVRDVAWSPDGSKIAYGGPDGTINIVDANNFNSQTPSNIMIFTDYDGNDFEIFRMNSDGTNVIQLTDNSTSDTDAILSADGNKIVFVSDRDDNAEIYSMDTNGNNVARLTNNSLPDWSPSWSPDGSQIVYTSGRFPQTDIYIMNGDGSNSINLTNSQAGERDTIWSPNGDKIAFVSDQDGEYEIYTIDADGANYKRLTSGGDNLPVVFPSWSPDGSMIVFKGNMGGIDKINADGSGHVPVTDKADIGNFLWLSNSQIIFTDSVQGWILANVDGSGQTVINLDWSQYAYNMSRPAVWESPPIIPNAYPIAEAGLDQTVISSEGEPVMITLNGSASDSDGQIARHDWFTNGDMLAIGLNPQIRLDVGIHHFEFVVTDDRGQTTTDEVIINVIVATPAI